MFAGQGEAPQIRLDIDRRKAETLGVSMDEINTTLAVMFGSGLHRLHRAARCAGEVVQADGAKRPGHRRHRPASRAQRAGRDGAAGDVRQGRLDLRPARLTRSTAIPRSTSRGQPRSGYSSGEAMRAMEQLMQGPRGIARVVRPVLEERLSGAQAPALFALSVLIVFLALAALYESWSIPLAVILVVPLGVLGALLGGEPARSAQRHLLQGRPDHHHRPLGEERHPHHRGGQDHYQEGMSLLQATLEAARACACDRSS